MAKRFASTYEYFDRPEDPNPTNLDKAEFNKRWQDIDDRVDAVEINSGFILFIPGTLTTGQKIRFLFPFKLQNVSVALGVITAPTDAAILVDIHTGVGAGVTIFTTQANRPTIVSAGLNGSFSANADVTPILAGAIGIIEVDQIGSTIAGADLAVTIRGERLA